MKLAPRLLRLTDHILAALLVATIAGSSLAFGGRVWWWPAALAALSLALGLTCLARMLFQGRMAVFKSPLAAFALLALALGVAQIAPLPASVSASLSPASRAAYTMGYLPDRARDIDPTLQHPEGPVNRSPVSVDRAATTRWLAGASACLLVALVVSRFADRLGHLYVVWGSVVGVFFLETALGAVQLLGGARGLYGFLVPGAGPRWAPNAADLLEGPGTLLLRAGSARPDHPAWPSSVAESAFPIGTLMGGPGAYLALAAIGLPLALGITLQVMAPRGSRESLANRLSASGQAGSTLLLAILLVASALLVGFLAGPELSVPFGLALLITGLPAARSTGLRWTAVGLTLLLALSLAGGAGLGRLMADSTSFPSPVRPESLSAATRVWADALPIVRDFPILGTGLGTFATIHPYYKSLDATTTTAMSSLAQWGVETGFAGLGLALVAAAWCLTRLPGAVRGVGTADRALVFGLIGAAAGFTLFSAVHWTLELGSVALAASAVGGTGHRWLAGGTDLFVERG